MWIDCSGVLPNDENEGNNMKLIKTPTILGLALVLVAGFGCASAQKGNVMRAQFAAEKGHYQYALNRLNEAEHLIEPAPQVKAEIVYLKGVCYQGLGRNADARGSFQYVAEQFPNTEFGYQAKEKLSNEARK
jgi:tetratricopeptide (TPR) repeat protein